MLCQSVSEFTVAFLFRIQRNQTFWIKFQFFDICDKGNLHSTLLEAFLASIRPWFTKMCSLNVFEDIAIVNLFFEVTLYSILGAPIPCDGCCVYKKSYIMFLTHVSDRKSGKVHFSSKSVLFAARESEKDLNTNTAKRNKWQNGQIAKWTNYNHIIWSLCHRNI